MLVQWNYYAHYGPLSPYVWWFGMVSLPSKRLIINPHSLPFSCGCVPTAQTLEEKYGSLRFPHLLSVPIVTARLG